MENIAQLGEFWAYLRNIGDFLDDFGLLKAGFWPIYMSMGYLKWVFGLFETHLARFWPLYVRMGEFKEGFDPFGWL